MSRPRIHSVKTVAAIGRGLQVLDAFQAGDPSLSLAQVVTRTGMLKSTVFRILLTFEESGYLVRLADGRYQLGAVFLQLGAIYRSVFRFDEIIEPVLRDLVRHTGESATFYLREGDFRVCLLRAESPHPVRDIVAAGSRLPMNETACSQVFRNQHDKHWHDVQADPQNALVFSIGAGNPHAAAVAAPVFNSSGLAGVLTLSGPRERFTPETVAAMRTHLQAAMTELAATLGATHGSPVSP